MFTAPRTIHVLIAALACAVATAVLPVAAAAATAATTTAVTTAKAKPKAKKSKKSTKAAKRCATIAPRKVTFRRDGRTAFGWLRWVKPKKRYRGKVRYRVSVDGKVKTTTRTKLRVAARPGKPYRFRVTSTRARSCSVRLNGTTPFLAPGTPGGVTASNVTETSATLSWKPAAAGDGKLVGYRVLRNGVTYKQVAAQSLTVALAPGAHYALAVAAVDSRGNVSPASAPVAVDTTRRPPTAPTGLSAVSVSESEIGLSWGASTVGSGRITSYRVYRDGVPLGATSGTTFVASNLAANHRYTFHVQAIDSLGVASPLSAPAVATTTRPIPTTGTAHAYLLATTDQSFTDFRAHYRNIGVVHPTYFECNRTTGAIQGRDDPLVTGWAQARAVKVLARFDCQGGATVDRILTNATLRAQTLAGLVRLTTTYGYDGLSLDFEAGSAVNRAAYTSFVAELGARLHAARKLLSIAVSPKSVDNVAHPRSGIFDYPALVPHVDWIFVMNWGIHWAWSAPGPIADLPWAANNADYVATMPQPRKWILGAPMYGFDWPGDGGQDEEGVPLEFSEVQALVNRVHAVPRFDAASGEWTFQYAGADGKTHTVWYPDATSLGQRFALARSRGLGGVGVWRLGSEDQRIWSQPLVAPGLTWPATG